MPITANVKEEMRRLKSSKWTVRIWFSDEPRRYTHQRNRDDVMLQIKAILETSIMFSPKEVAGLICSYLDCEDNVAALEVLSNATLNGVVLYFDWP